MMTLGFDVYFVPSEALLENFLEDQSFIFYQEKECFATNQNSMNDSCLS